MGGIHAENEPDQTNVMYILNYSGPTEINWALDSNDPLAANGGKNPLEISASLH
jgi:hypothetical protein